jgi:hypothetical protein
MFTKLVLTMCLLYHQTVEVVEQTVSIENCNCNLTAGSESKLTVAEQRMGVVLAIGALSHHTVSGTTSVQSLSNTVVDFMGPLLQSEGLLF